MSCSEMLLSNMCHLTPYLQVVNTAHVRDIGTLLRMAMSAWGYLLISRKMFHICYKATQFP